MLVSLQENQKVYLVIHDDETNQTVQYCSDPRNFGSKQIAKLYARQVPKAGTPSRRVRKPRKRTLRVTQAGSGKLSGAVSKKCNSDKLGTINSMHEGTCPDSTQEY